MEIEGKYSKAIVYSENIDKTTYAQILQLVNHPTFSQTVRIMPDTHAGASNSVIGFTMPFSDSIIPNTVGVDIGCGMVSIKLDAENQDFKKVDKKIRNVVPIGNLKGVHKSAILNFAHDFPFDKANEQLWQFTQKFNHQLGTSFIPIEYNFEWFEKKCKQINVNAAYVVKSLGTLGGGNHFIEIGKSTVDGSLWLTVHSGSRQLGQKIARYHSMIAKKNAAFENPDFRKEFEAIKAKLVAENKRHKINKARKKLKEKYLAEVVKVPTNMEYLQGEAMYDYFVDMIFAQTYAQKNRALMISLICNTNQFKELDRIESVHNYIDFGDLIIRKGAIRSYEQERMIIPFNMADGILICEGKSNPEWNFSAPHGAGRIMSRNEAKKSLSMKEYRHIMKKNKVFSTSVSVATIDEAPQAYKSAKIIEKSIEPTAKILFKLKPVYNLKASK